MRAVVQRVTGACVHVDGKLVSTIGPGLVALIGISTEDSRDDIVPLANKILNLRFWNHNQKSWTIDPPPHYPVSEHRAQPPSIGPSNTPTNEAGIDLSDDVTEDSEVSRKNQVWGGQPWKSSVVQFEGEILCSWYWTPWAVQREVQRN